MLPTWWAGARSELVPPYVNKAMALPFQREANEGRFPAGHAERQSLVERFNPEQLHRAIGTLIEMPNGS